MSKYQSTPHSTFNLGYHVVFCTKYRYRLLRYGAAVTLKNLFLQKAEQLGIAIRAMEIMPEHVHLFLALKPADTEHNLHLQHAIQPSKKPLSPYQGTDRQGAQAPNGPKCQDNLREVPHHQEMTRP